MKIASLSDKEIELIISALDYQNYEFATYEDESGHYDLKLKLEQCLNQTKWPTYYPSNVVDCCMKGIKIKIY
ncbi:hypothetical protein [Brevibacillus laterosporus]|uniref:hypothetical protein n=1 Tax=Brevibacillus laterosporus TaxID=1465 RepID=UPI0015E1EDD2|nr:hypothetical protein [Brevibacillus laterosporus]MED1666450.1 hypothetical protein [Brevibacillus laterosporus]MED1667516.1 hypothetical protein [Brevibacillus laterosporus]MED1719320.1 hypothetical protein [Brevibacillus laterosporus]